MAASVRSPTASTTTTTSTATGATGDIPVRVVGAYTVPPSEPHPYRPFCTACNDDPLAYTAGLADAVNGAIINEKNTLTPFHTRGQDFRKIIRDDAATLAGLDVTREQIAARLSEILTAAKLINNLSTPITTITSRAAAAAGRQSLSVHCNMNIDCSSSSDEEPYDPIAKDELVLRFDGGSTRDVRIALPPGCRAWVCWNRRYALVEEQYFVTLFTWGGARTCPFYQNAAEREYYGYRYGSEDMVIINLKTMEHLWVGTLLPHLIEMHGYFEGPGVFFRLDPERVTRVLEITPLRQCGLLHSGHGAWDRATTVVAWRKPINEATALERVREEQEAPVTPERNPRCELLNGRYIGIAYVAGRAGWNRQERMIVYPTDLVDVDRSISSPLEETAFGFPIPPVYPNHLQLDYKETFSEKPLLRWDPSNHAQQPHGFRRLMRALAQLALHPKCAETLGAVPVEVLYEIGGRLWDAVRTQIKPYAGSNAATYATPRG